MEGRMPRHAIRWPEAEVLHRPFDKMDDVGMGNDHAFGNPCRSRGEENMRGIAARRLYVTGAVEHRSTSCRVNSGLKWFPLAGSYVVHPTRMESRNRSCLNSSSKRPATGPPASTHLFSQESSMRASRPGGLAESRGT